LSDYAGQTLRGSLSPEATLAVAERGRRSAQEAALAPTEGFIRLLGSEVEALCRLARFEDALASANEGLALARRSGLASYALTAPVSRLYLFTGRLAELKDLADSFETDGGGMQRAAARAHAGYVRALLASLAGDFAGAARLCEEIVLSPENTPGLDYLLHAAHFEATVSFAMAQEPDLAAAALARAQAHLERAPSVWHATMLRRAEAIILMQRGELNQARQRIEATQATFTLLGDKVQAALEVGGLSMIALISGAPDAADQMARALADIEALGVDTKFLERRARVITTPAAPTWREQTMAEKLVVAVDRLSVKGLDEAAFRRELTAVLTKLFPGREPVVGGAELERDGAFVKTGDGDGALYFGLRGSVDAEQRAALSLLASFLRQHAPSAPAFAEADLQLEGLLPAFIAASPSTRQLKSEIVRLSRSNATILIRGESGAGKEVVARAVHDASQRADKPYVTLNCASVPRELFESQLFGYRKGSFTGAVNDSAGVIRAADGGTLFLDEIGELPLEMQPKLLRFLENGEVQPLGEQRPRRVDVRVIAATHRDLSRLVHEQRFREDLYYRLNVIPLTVPPLRERKEDVIALARLFIGRAVPADTPPPQLAVDAVRALEAYTWPGNVRELRNVVDRALAFAPIPSVLSAEHLRISLA
jgi:MoxR-like ATPase